MSKQQEPNQLGAYLSMLSDYGFKVAFGNQENTEFLRRALKALMQSNVPIKSITFLKNDFEGALKESRGARVDVLCEDERGQVFIIEMQVDRTENFIHRAKHYAFLVFNDMVKRGKYKYDDLKKIYMVSFLAKNTYSTNLYHQVGTLKNQGGEVIDDQITHIIVELNKFNKSYKEIDNDLDKLIYTMKQTASKQFQEADFMHENWLSTALDKLNTANLSAEERMHLELDIAYRATYEEGFRDEGREEGRAEERAKAKEAQNARVLKLNQFASKQQIAEIEHLSVAEVEAILKEA